MRVIGYWMGSGPGPVESGWVPMRDVCVIAGTNDSGKSRLLRRIESDLNAVERLRAGDSAPDALVFLELERDELQSLLEETFQAISERSAEVPRPSHDPAADWLCVLEREAGSRPGFAVVAEQLARSRTIAVEPYLERDGHPTLLVHWCGRPLAETDDRALVEAFLADGRPPDHLDPRAPTLLTQVGTFDGPLLPAPQRLPVEEPTLEEAVTTAVSQWLVVRNMLLTISEGDRTFAQVVDDDGSLWLTRDPPEPRELWLDTRTEHAVQIHEDVLDAFRAITAGARAASVSFLQARYAVVVEPAPISVWGVRPPVAMTLAPAAQEDEDAPAPSPFPLAEAADGLRLWAQLAVAEGVDALREKTAHLLNSLPMIAGDVFEGELEQARDWVEELEQRGALDPAAPDRALEHDERLAWWGRESGRAGRDIDPASMRCFRPTLYLIDEPERHLNPRLVRGAASWLASHLAGRRSQAVVVTHSAGFLGLGGNASFVHVDRAGRRSSVEAFEPHRLSLLHKVSMQLGLDHGELLALTRLLLFVEGESDRAVLDEFFGPRLHAAGVVVVPIAGVRNHPLIVEGEVLMRYCAHRAAVVFDSLSEECVAALAADPELRRSARKKPPIECQMMAALLDAAEAAGRKLDPLALPADDMFELLDEQVLKELYTAFPGHAEARERHRRRGRKEESYWRYLTEALKVPAKSVTTYRQVAEQMRLRGIVPDALERLVMQVEALARME